MPTWFDIVLDGKAWVVRCENAECGRYLTQAQAFSAAVNEARRLKDAGRPAQVRVLREGVTTDLFLSLY